MLQKLVPKPPKSALLSITDTCACTINSPWLKAYIQELLKLRSLDSKLPEAWLGFCKMETYKVQKYLNFVQGISITVAVNVDIYDNAMIFKVMFSVMMFSVLFLTLWLWHNITIILLWSSVVRKTVTLLASSCMADIFNSSILMCNYVVSFCCSLVLIGKLRVEMNFCRLKLSILIPKELLFLC